MPFAKGQSGNRQGRKTGSKNKSTPALQEFAKSIVDSEEYRARLERQMVAGELHPKIEEKLLNYAYPEQKQERTAGITINLGLITQGQPPAIAIQAEPILQIDSSSASVALERVKTG